MYDDDEGFDQLSEENDALKAELEKVRSELASKGTTTPQTPPSETFDEFDAEALLRRADEEYIAGNFQRALEIKSFVAQGRVPPSLQTPETSPEPVTREKLEADIEAARERAAEAQAAGDVRASVAAKAAIVQGMGKAAQL